jgi:hypothetical protein
MGRRGQADELSVKKRGGGNASVANLFLYDFDQCVMLMGTHPEIAATAGTFSCAI